MSVYRKHFVVSLLAYVLQREADAAAVCSKTGIDLQAIKQGTSPDLTDQQFDDLWNHAAEATNDPLFGLHLGESMRLAALGVVGDIIRNSTTIGDAVTQTAAFLTLVTDLFTMTVTQKGKEFSLLFEPSQPQAGRYPHAYRHMLDLAMVFALHEVDGLILAKINPQAITLPPHTAENGAEYTRVMRCKPAKVFGSGRIAFDAAFWYEPIVLADYALQRELIQKAKAMRRDSITPQKLSENITAWLMSNAYLGMPSLEQLAANFNTSTRSLQRRLNEEGVTYQQLTDAMRQSLAIHYLGTGQYAVKEVAYMLGYNELSAFTRAFRRWTGTTPARFKANYPVR